MGIALETRKLLEMGAADVGRRLRGRDGQMTIELAAALPVLIVVAVIAINALCFFEDCAVFDRVAHESIRVYAASPGYGQDGAQSCALIEQNIVAVLDRDNVEVSVTRSSAGFDLETYSATIEYAPTLFGMGLRSEVFGVPLPRLAHSTSLVVDVYKSGVII